MSESWGGVGTGNPEIPQHVQRSWIDNGGEGALEVKNKFISVANSETDKQLVRSNSWSAFSSSTSSQPDSSASKTDSNGDVTRQHYDAPPHITWEDGNSFDASDSSDGLSIKETVELSAEVASERRNILIHGLSEETHPHYSGQCVPCIHLLNSNSCARGDKCRFCHLPHVDAKKSRRRPCKSTRNRCKAALDLLEEKYKDDPETKAQELQNLMARHPYLYTLVQARNETDDPQSNAGQSSQSAAHTHGESAQASGDVRRRNKVSL
eukprot:TRINITY_DN6389_c0_g1_i1.p1 TRINITY_DN6389_c0_g1~~TRINITY_DN6389_c0_g1_i1.p1  ORF type:complete len:276 (+),score=36.46 TRINITY_DN6389_c0_g1_i1:33-830(+)